MTATLIAVLAAAEEKSKALFYVMGPIAAVWAVVVTALGLTRPDFPGSEAGRRAVMLVTVLVVLGATGTAVITA
jgi:hypothetical protein